MLLVYDWWEQAQSPNTVVPPIEQKSEEYSKRCFMGDRMDRNDVNPERCVCLCYVKSGTQNFF